MAKKKMKEEPIPGWHAWLKVIEPIRLANLKEGEKDHLRQLRAEEIEIQKWFTEEGYPIGGTIGRRQARRRENTISVGKRRLQK